MTPELAEVIRWNRDQAAAAREMADRARRAGRDEDAVLRREQTATFHDRVADRAEELAQQEEQKSRTEAQRPTPDGSVSSPIPVRSLEEIPGGAAGGLVSMSLHGVTLWHEREGRLAPGVVAERVSLALKKGGSSP